MVSEYSWPSIFIDLVKMIVSRKCKITAIDPINTIFIKYCTSFCWSTQQQNSWVLVLRKYWWNHSRSSYLMQDTFDVKSLCAGPTLSVLTRSWLNENGIASCIWSLVSSLRVWESCTILRKLTKFPSTWSGRAVWSRMRSLKWTALKCIKVLNSWTCEGFPVWRL